MSRVFPLSMVTNIYLGYPLVNTLEALSKHDINLVEISSIDQVCEHIKVEEMSLVYLDEILQELNEAKLKSIAFSGHVDLTEEVGVKNFLIKMEFAKGLGAEIINTNAGPANRLKEFHLNMRQVIKKAEELELKVGLESHGDIMGTGRESVEIIKEFNHPLVRLNYDTGNVFYHSQGQVKPDEDILYALDYMDYIHFKDATLDKQGNYQYCAIGAGILKIDKILETLSDYDRVIPLAFEAPVFLKCTDFKHLEKAPAPLALTEIDQVIDGSLKFINKYVRTA